MKFHKACAVPLFAIAACSSAHSAEPISTISASVNGIQFLLRDLTPDDGHEPGFTFVDNIYPVSQPITRITLTGQQLALEEGVLVPMQSVDNGLYANASGSVSFDSEGLAHVHSEVQQLGVVYGDYFAYELITQTGKFGYAAIDTAITLYPNSELTILVSATSQITRNSIAPDGTLLVAGTQVLLESQSFSTKACWGGVLFPGWTTPTTCASPGYGGANDFQTGSASFTIASGPSGPSYHFPFSITSFAFIQSAVPVPELPTWILFTSAIGLVVRFARTRGTGEA